MENEFRNVSLEKGDVLLFNRGLLHIEEVIINQI